MSPFVSIITVSLNAADSIGATIASIHWQQADFAFEHICVDGGSTDGTRAIIDEWAERSPRIRKLYEPDRGIFDAMNKGLGAARGEYVLFLNADDFLLDSRTLSAALHGLTLGAPTNPDLILGDAIMGSPGTWGIWRHRLVPRLLGRVRGAGLYPVHQGQFARRELLERAGGFDISQRLGADVTSYFDIERRFRPSTRLLRRDVAVMRGGGAANADARAIRVGSIEIYRHLVGRHSRARSIAMVVIKSLQSISELRVGRCPGTRWFADSRLVVDSTLAGS